MWWGILSHCVLFVHCLFFLSCVALMLCSRKSFTAMGGMGSMGMGGMGMGGMGMGGALAAALEPRKLCKPCCVLKTKPISDALVVLNDYLHPPAQRTPT